VIGRRDLLAGGALPAVLPAVAETFPQAESWAGVALRRNGTGTRRYLGVEVYRAALYLPAPLRDAAAILADPLPKLILLRYARAVTAAVATTGLKFRPLER
jgi:hypothetical protein